MITFPNAKINLGLNIVSKRSDGYHNLETIFYPIAIKDALEIIPAKEGKDLFVEAGIKVDAAPENNLVMKALQLLRKGYDIPPLEIHLLKKIPFGAGIGGGSADASFMLKLLNDNFGLKIENAELIRLAAKIGADCPFFIYNKPMFAAGIGDLLEDIDVCLKGYSLVLVKPDIHIPTKDAFALITPRQPQMSLKDIVKHPVEEWKDMMFNDFEKSIFPTYRAIENIKNKLYDMGAVYTSMSGSGSSVYAVFNSESNVSIAPEFESCFVWEEKE